MISELISYLHPLVLQLQSAICLQFDVTFELRTREKKIKASEEFLNDFFTQELEEQRPETLLNSLSNHIASSDPCLLDYRKAAPIYRNALFVMLKAQVK